MICRFLVAGEFEFWDPLRVECGQHGQESVSIHSNWQPVNYNAIQVDALPSPPSQSPLRNSYIAYFCRTSVAWVFLPPATSFEWMASIWHTVVPRTTHQPQLWFFGGGEIFRGDRAGTNTYTEFAQNRRDRLRIVPRPVRFRGAKIKNIWNVHHRNEMNRIHSQSFSASLSLLCH